MTDVNHLLIQYWLVVNLTHWPTIDWANELNCMEFLMKETSAWNDFCIYLSLSLHLPFDLELTCFELTDPSNTPVYAHDSRVIYYWGIS